MNKENDLNRRFLVDVLDFKSDDVNAMSDETVAISVAISFVAMAIIVLHKSLGEKINANRS